MLMLTFIRAVLILGLLHGSGVLGAEFDPFPFSPGFNIAKVVELGEAVSSHSWEYGVTSQALLELFNPSISVFGSRPFPVSTLRKENVKSLTYASSKIVIGEGANALSDGDGAVGDPASLGVSAVLLGRRNQTFAIAAADQLDYVVNGAPRAPNGAISHRVDIVELW